MRIAKNYRSKKHHELRAAGNRLNVETKLFADNLPGFYGELVYYRKGEFDYRLNSIQYIEFFLRQLFKEETEKCDLDINMFVVGAHLGEILKNEIGGRWVRANKPTITPSDIDFLIEYQLPNGRRLDLTAKAWSCFYSRNRGAMSRFIEAIIQQVQDKNTAPLNLRIEEDMEETIVKSPEHFEIFQNCSVAATSPN